MSIVTNYASPEAEEALRRQRKTATFTSVIVSVLVVVLLGLILTLFLLPSLVISNSALVTYQSNKVEEKEPERKMMSPQIQRKPSAPSSAMSKVIVANMPSPVAIPVPEVDVPEPSTDFGNGDDFGSGWGNGDGDGGGGSFFGQSVRADRIVFVVDFSSSMGAPGRQELMRKELSTSISQLSSGTNFAVLFFAGHAWEAGSQNKIGNKLITVVGQGGKRYEWVPRKGSHGWQSKGLTQRVNWLKASNKQIAESTKIVKTTPLGRGTVWDNGLLMALDMNPRPQVIFFMTDGAASGSAAWAKEVGGKAKSKGVKINCIALMEPQAHKDLDVMAKLTNGQFTVVTKDGKRRKVR